MADKVFLHIGLPKAATTYLQTIFWADRKRARKDGVLIPGRERRDHLWASRVVREVPMIARSPRTHQTSWDRLVTELAGWSGTGLVSHEFFAACAPEQAQRMVADLAPAEVHVVVNAREPLGLFTASWQESLKNKDTTPMAEYALEESDNPNAIWNWRTLDLRLVLERWSQAVPAERIHILPLDGAGEPRDGIWRRFAELVGLDPDGYDLSVSFPNTSMGVVEAETLRRINAHLDDFNKAFDRGVYIRTYLADERLVARQGERYWPPADRVEDCRRRARRALEHLAAHPYDVRGNLANLEVPDVLEPRREPDSVTDAEVAGVAVELVATMLGDVRSLRDEVAALRDA